ncbi:MAG: DUF4340 domain-containing protein [Rhodospirillales bacterium]|nr:DUF4340 domain-containing protein [Rhodospirillales bacterium]
MTPKTVIKLGIVTAIAVVAAAAGVANQMSGTQPARTSEPVFAGLEDRLDAVATISILTAKDETTVVRDGALWTVKEKDGFPANRDEVRKALIQLSQLQLVEAKTQKPDLYPRIEVEDIEQEGAKSALVSLMDESGEAVASLIVGKSKFDMAGGSGRGLYLRKPDEDRAWLAKGEFDPGRNADEWLAKDILDIGGKEIRRITTNSSDGGVMVFARQDRESGFTLEGVDDGKKLKDDALSSLDGALSGLRLTDVAAADRKEMPEEKTVEAEIVTFGGLVLNLSLTDGEDGIWAAIEASAGAPAEADKTGQGKDPAEQAEEINGRVSGWVFQVPDFKLRTLLKPRKDLIEG